MPPNKQIVPVSDVMTRRVRTAEPSQDLAEIWRILQEEGCHHIPIVEKRRPVGMISASDLVRAAHEFGTHRAGTSEISPGLPSDVDAGEIMSTELETIHVNESVDAAIDRIGRGDIHALVVLDDEGSLAGIVTNHDLLHYLAN